MSKKMLIIGVICAILAMYLVGVMAAEDSDSSEDEVTAPDRERPGMSDRSFKDSNEASDDERPVTPQQSDDGLLPSDDSFNGIDKSLQDAIRNVPSADSSNNGIDKSLQDAIRNVPFADPNDPEDPPPSDERCNSCMDEFKRRWNMSCERQFQRDPASMSFQCQTMFGMCDRYCHGLPSLVGPGN